MSIQNPNVPFTCSRFAKALQNGLFDVDGMDTMCTWIGQDGRFWIEYRDNNIGSYHAFPVATVKEEDGQTPK